MAEIGRNHVIKAKSVKVGVRTSISGTKNLNGLCKMPKIASIPRIDIAVLRNENQLLCEYTTHIAPTNDVLNRNAIAVDSLVSELCEMAKESISASGSASSVMSFALTVAPSTLALTVFAVAAAG